MNGTPTAAAMMLLEYPYKTEREDGRFARQSNCRGLLPEDSVTTFNYDEVDKTLFTPTAKGKRRKMTGISVDHYEEARLYVGQIIDLNERERIIVAARVFLTPPMKFKQIARAMRIQPTEVRRHLHTALGKMRMAPPAFMYKPHVSSNTP